MISDQFNYDIRRVDPQGNITTVAGGGGDADTDDIQALQASVSPSEIATGPDGSIYFSEQASCDPDCGLSRVRRLSPAGFITTVAGGRNRGFAGDGGPATQALLYFPGALAVSPDGSLYIVDQVNQRVRKVDTSGIISTVAGNGVFRSSGDGGLATAASLRLSNSHGIAVSPDGSFYVVDGGERVRKVTPDGIITTVVGGGNDTSGPNGVLATNVANISPVAITVAPDGALFVATSDSIVYRIGGDGIMRTVAGTSHVNSAGPASNVLSTESWFGSITALGAGPDGSLYLVNGGSGGWVDRIAPPLPGYSFGEFVVPSPNGREFYVFSDGLHRRTVDATTNAVLYTFGYDTQDRLIAVTDGVGRQTVIERSSSSGAPAAITAPGGQRTTLNTDDLGRVTLLTDPSSATVGLTYTQDGLLTSLRDARGYVHTFSYDVDGRLTRDATPAGGSLSLSRSTSTDNLTATVQVTTALGHSTRHDVQRPLDGSVIETTTDPSGAQTLTTITPGGATLTQTGPNGTVIKIDNGSDPRFGPLVPALRSKSIRLPSGTTMTITGNRTVSLSDPNNPLSLTGQIDKYAINGRTFTYAYDNATRQGSMTSPNGRSIALALDDFLRPLTMQLPGVASLNYTYNDRGYIAAISQGSRSATFSYDPLGRLAALRDPLGHTTTYDYDTGDRVTKITRADGAITQYAYDASGNLISLTPPSRPAHSFTFTSINQSDSYAGPFGAGALHYSYDADGNLSAIARADGSLIGINYDSAGRVSGMTTPTGTISYAYDVADRLTGVATSTGSSLALDYDGILLRGRTWSGPVAGTVSVWRDNNFRVTTDFVNGASSVSYSYDTDGLLTAAGSLAIQRDPANGLLMATTLSSFADKYTYDDFGEIVGYTATLNGSPILMSTISRDALGRVAARSEGLLTSSVSQTATYTYDDAGRLTNVMNAGAQTSYTYDPNGNRLSRAAPFGTDSGTYDDQDRLLTYGNATYAYSASGELRTKTMAKGTTTYNYDAFGHLLNVSLPDGRVIDYIIDAAGRRVGKKVNGVLVAGWLYADRTRVIAELDGSGQTRSRFVYASRFNVPDYFVQGGITYRIVSNEMGSPRVVLNLSTGAIAQMIGYDEFGNVLADTNPGFQPFGFGGGLYDSDTGLVRFGARDYDPQTGRWTAKDPLMFNGGDTNLYGYSMNDPVNMLDPSGLISQETQWWADYAANGNVLQRTAGLVFGTFAALVPDTIGFGSDATATLPSVPGAPGPGYTGGWGAQTFLNAPCNSSERAGVYTFHGPAATVPPGYLGANLAQFNMAWSPNLRQGASSWGGPFNQVSFGEGNWSGGVFWSPDHNWIGISIGYGPSTAPASVSAGRTTYTRHF